MFSPGFDVNMAEIFGTLCYGATLVLKDPHDPYQHLSRVQATMITPSFLSVCKPQDYPNLDTILFAGEAVPQALSDRWSGGRKVYNSYGPCECTIGALFKLLHPGEPVTLGRPIPRVGVYLLDRHNCPVPQGVIGEICLSGLQVMKGYLGEHMKEVSAEKFVPDPFVHGQRMYKTGDLAMWTPTMDVVFLGRRDNQIKVRGFRVELEEVENAILSADPAVKQAAAVVVGDSIHAFVSPENVDLSKLGPSLQTLIPAYACPSRIVTLPCLPLTSNQKLDRKALSKLEIGTSTTNVQSLSGTEQLVADVWRETANIALDVNIGRSDDYMTVGGNSLGQIRVAQTLSRRFGFPVPLIMVLKNTILSELAHALDQYMEQCKTEDTPATSVDSFDDSGSSPRSELSYVEQELYLLQSLSKSSPTFNIACTFELQGDVNINFLVEAIKSVVATHGVLNTCYTCIEGTVTHKVCQNPFHALQRREHDSEEFDLQAWVDTPFDLHSDRLLKVAILEKQSKVVVSTVQHHTVSDYTSLGIFFTAVGLAYERIISDAQSDSPDYRKPNSNRVRETWNGWKNHSLQDDVSYWKAQYEDRPSLPLSNIYDLPLPDVGDFQSILIPGPSETVTLAHCLGAVALAMSRATGANDFVVCIPYDRREDAGNEHMLGCFLDRLPVRLTLTEDIMNQPASLYSYAESRLHESLSHAIPYKDIIDAVGDAARFDIMLTYHRREDALQNKLRLPGITVTELPIRPKGAKFPVLFEFTDTSSGLRCDVEYMTRLVTDEVIGGITDVIAGILGSPLSALQDTTHLIVREVHKVKPPSPQNDNRTATSEDLHLVQEAFAIALETEINSVNVDHTYNELGGSPIVSVRIQWVLKQKGYEVDLKDIFVGRTPKAIAARLRPQSIEQVGYVI
jgi:non-ribosomal peptide synthetase component F